MYILTLNNNFCNKHINFFDRLLVEGTLPKRFISAIQQALARF